jgi:hypothetical protein
VQPVAIQASSASLGSMARSLVIATPSGRGARGGPAKIQTSSKPVK